LTLKHIRHYCFPKVTKYTNFDQHEGRGEGALVLTWKLVIVKEKDILNIFYAKNLEAIKIIKMLNT
jgi:hypothetical protein